MRSPSTDPDAAGTPGPARLPSAFVVAAVTAIALVAWLMVCRVGHAFELEWIEGAVVDHVERVRQGLGVYVEPGPDHIALLYTPLLYYLGALVSFVTGVGFAAPRVVGVLATLACGWLLYRCVTRLGGARSHGLAAVGVFAAGYGYVQSWYDLARNDTLFVAWMLATVSLLHRGGRRAVAWAALTSVLAFLAKQTALMWLPALVVGAMLGDWRRGVRYAVLTAAGIGATVWAFDRGTDGWFTFFVFDMPGAHGTQSDRVLGFWIEDLVPLLPMAAATGWVLLRLWRTGERRSAWLLAAFAGGGLLTSWLSRLHLGGFDNVLLYAFAAGCGFVALLPALVATPGARRVAHALLALQFVLLVVDVRSVWLDRPVLQLDPRRFAPPPAHAAAGRQMVAFLRSVPGPVLLPFHGHLAARAGKPSTAHAVALGDLMQRLRPERLGAEGGRDRRAEQAIREGFAAALREQRWQAIVLDEPFGAVFEQQFAPARYGYRRRDLPIDAPAAFAPPIGLRLQAPYVLTPR